MVAAFQSVIARVWRNHRGWLLALGLLLALSYWLPVAAQTPSTVDDADPATVVLPPVQMRLPFVIGESPTAQNCPTASSNHYETLQPNHPHKHDRPPTLDPDLNVNMRGYVRTTALLGLVAIDGPTDEDAPQLAYLFHPQRVPSFHANYQINDWDWGCCPWGKVGQPIKQPEVTMVEMATTPGEALYPARRHKRIGGDYVALVLYAEKYGITFTYTREDSPAVGYLVHIESLCVDPTLLALYQQTNSAGRAELPTLRNEDSIGIAASDSIQVAVRDTGSFMDPRSGKDWWQDRVRAILAARAVQ